MAHILVIEDHEDVRENVAEILSLAGYEVTTAADGKIGVEKALANPPDLILCDVMMPELDGFGVLRILSKNPACMDIPFIFLTAKTEQTDFRKGMGLGADDYITKPFDDVELLDAIEVRLRKVKKLRKSFDGTPEGIQKFYSEAKANQALKKLSENREVLTLNKKTKVFEQGQQAHWLYFITKGKIKCYKTNEYGKELITHIYQKGDFFGFIPLIENSAYQETAAVIEDAKVQLIPKDDFNLLLYSTKDFSIQFIKMLANQVNEVEQNLINLAYDSVRQKVAKSLLSLFDKYEIGGKAKFSILREDLAAIAGTAKETVIRTLSDFKDEKLIAIVENDIIIEDDQPLRNLRY
ncbi:MAG: response regulator [Saprospiraceae bacterium]|nr:response regulator [Saprospiraceae bacterium]